MQNDLSYGPSNRWYDPPDVDREPCCEKYEDDEDHDWQACEFFGVDAGGLWSR